jgi:YD repeat-containing protein
MTELTGYRFYEHAGGRLDYEYITDKYLYDSTYIVRATDWDLAERQPWTSYTITQAIFGLDSVMVASIEALMDDGSYTRLDKSYFGGLMNHPIHYQDRWSRWDAEGRLESTHETTWLAPGRTLGDTTYQDLDYDRGTGRLDFSLIRYGDGREEAIDYDLATGSKDYVLTTYRGGQVVAQDWNPATGLLDYARTTDADGHTLDQDYDSAGRLDYTVERWADGHTLDQDHDAAGRLAHAVERWADGRVLVTDYDAAGGIDYVVDRRADGHRLDQDYDAAGRLDYMVERWADGRMLVTDYDLANQYDWTSYSIAYAASGQIGTVTVL